MPETYGCLECGAMSEADRAARCRSKVCPEPQATEGQRTNKRQRDDDLARAKDAQMRRALAVPKEAQPDPALAPRRTRRAAKTPDTWGSVYNRWLARGHDHGSAAYEADKWERRQARKAPAAPAA